MKIWKAILYIRVATADQPDAFLRQEKALKDYCAIHGIQVIGVYKDISPGKTFNRPEFTLLLDFLEQNKGVANIILVTSMDRFSRDWPAAVAMADQLHDLEVDVRAIELFASPVNMDKISLN